MSTIRERVAEFDALTKAHPDERYMCMGVAADRHDLLVAGDALADAGTKAAFWMRMESDGRSNPLADALRAALVRLDGAS